VKLSQEEFKAILKVKVLSSLKSDGESARRDSGLTGDRAGKDLRQQRLTLTRREWNESNYFPRNHTVRPSLVSPSSSSKLEYDYLMLFTNERNAYNY
jgi:hypothetical protein